MFKKITQYLSLALLLIFPITLLSSCGGGGNIDVVTSVKQLNDEAARIGVLTGCNHDEHVEKKIPNATIDYFNSNSDMVINLQTGKIRAAACDQPVARTILTQYDNISMLDEMLENLDYAFIFHKSPEVVTINNEVNHYIDGIKANGQLDALQKKWFDAADLSKVDMTSYADLPATKGTIRAAVADNPPFVFTVTDSFAGFDVEVLALFCKENGYALEISNVSVDAIVASVVSGKSDVGCGGFTITEERKATMNFSSTLYSGGTALIVLNGKPAGGNMNFFEMIADGFDKTFIREDRWKLFLSGIVTTLLITFLSIVLGTGIGFGVFLLCRNGNKAFNIVAKVCAYIIQGLPAVVLLMIFYYIIFGSVSIPGEYVSVFAFTLIFGAGVFNMLKGGVATVDKGQMEAAFALGYRERKAFFKIILPQALPHMLPTYKGEITSLIKATAIVGYVAVQDVTKVGDIIRSRTFEPFFPLISIAILYFVLAALLILIVNLIGKTLDTKHRKNKKLLKGVKLS